MPAWKPTARAREHFIPTAETGFHAIDDDVKLPLIGRRGGSIRIARHELLHLRAQCEADAIRFLPIRGAKLRCPPLQPGGIGACRATAGLLDEVSTHEKFDRHVL